jgi:hypothetical protein
MTLEELERELAALEVDGETAAAIVSEIDTAALHLLAGSIRLELIERYQGKPLDRSRFH